MALTPAQKRKYGIGHRANRGEELREVWMSLIFFGPDEGEPSYLEIYKEFINREPDKRFTTGDFSDGQ